jgi:hypothetical protein
MTGLPPRIDGDDVDRKVRQLAAIFATRGDTRHLRDMLLREIVRLYDEIPADDQVWGAADDLLALHEHAHEDGPYPHLAVDAQFALSTLANALDTALSGNSILSQRELLDAKRALGLVAALIDDLAIEVGRDRRRRADLWSRP